MQGSANLLPRRYVFSCAKGDKRSDYWQPEHRNVGAMPTVQTHTKRAFLHGYLDVDSDEPIGIMPPAWWF